MARQMRFTILHPPSSILCGCGLAALRLARYFGLSEGFWLGLQADYELMRRRREIGPELSQIVPREAA